MNLYEKMGDQLRSLFHDLTHGKDVEQKLVSIMAAAHQMGGSILTEAKELQQDIEAYLQKPAHGNRIKKHIEKLEQQTRQL